MDTQAKVLTVWITYAIGIIVTGTPFAGVIAAYFWRNTNGEPGFAGHNAAQIRLFWRGFLGWLVAITIIICGIAFGVSNDMDDPPTLMWVGLLVAAVVQVVFTVYSIIGIVRTAKKTNWPGSEPDLDHNTVFS